MTANLKLTPVQFRDLRERLGWTRSQMAIALGVTERTIGRYEDGRRAISATVAILLRMLVIQRHKEGAKHEA